MENIKFSIIVPVYNVERYLKRCIYSILNQSYTNFELICLNDGSTDTSYKILQEIQINHPSITIINQDNQGLGQTRNNGLNYVSGDYIWFVDSDDWLENNSLQTIVESINKNKKWDIILFDAFRSESFKSKSIMKSIRKQIFEFENIENEYLIELFKGDALYAAWNKVFKSDTLINSNFKFESGFYEDISIMNYYYNQKTSLCYINKPLYNYYVNNSSIMKTYDMRILDIFKQFSCVYNTFSTDLKYRFLLGGFFYKLMLDTTDRLKNTTDDSIRIHYFKSFNNWNKKFGFFSKYCLLNSEITLKRKIKILIFLFIANSLNRI